LGRSVPGRGRQGRGFGPVPSHIHRPIRVADIGHRTGEQHQNGGAVLLVRVHPDGRVLRRHVHDDRLGAQQTGARTHGQRFGHHGHGRRVRLRRLRRHTVHRHQFRLAVPHVQ